jgi:hypothetical protein
MPTGSWALRDLMAGKNVKDWDIFFVNKEDWINFNEEMKEYKIQFTDSILKNITVEKFKIDDRLIDSIYYPHVQHSEHIVDTFDFTINMLWYDPVDSEIKGSLKYDVDTIIDHIIDRKLVVGDNLWYRATYFRALKRYDRFRNQGFTIDDENRLKYIRYINLLKPVNLVEKMGSVER